MRSFLEWYVWLEEVSDSHTRWIPARLSLAAGGAKLLLLLLLLRRSTATALISVGLNGGQDGVYDSRKTNVC
jgi:hypothetical protein